MKNVWRSVTDDPPPAYDDVLTCRLESEEYVMLVGWACEMGRWYDNIDRPLSYADDANNTVPPSHWRLLPEPPE